MSNLLEKYKDTLGNQLWRLNSLYSIVDKNGDKIKFTMNAHQERLYNEMWYCNVILKARQLGYTSFIQIFLLDQALFTSNVKAGVIAHTLRDAQIIFNDKLKFAWQNLPDQIRDIRPLIRDSATELAFPNGSSIRVGASMRSGTLNFLHVSELGKICAKYPEKAREIKTGALNTIQAGQVVFIESTAEGQEGDFYNICQSAQELQRLGTKLTPLDFKFHFEPWWKHDGYVLNPNGVIITPEDEAYFLKIENEIGQKLSLGQKAWYVKKAELQEGDMKREFPSTERESFEASVEGAYYGDLLAKAESQGRVGEFKAEADFPVHTVWDIGMHDSTAIWFWQILPNEIRHVGYFENSGEGVPYYADTLKEMYKENDWLRNEDCIDWVPHDAKVREWGTKKTRVEQMISNGLKPKVVKNLAFYDGINAVRNTLKISTFDQRLCKNGLKALKNYRKEWDDARGIWSKTPFRNFATHGADSRRYLACAYRELEIKVEEKPEPDNGMPTMAEIIQSNIARARQ